MFRTLFSVCALFGSMLLVCKGLDQSRAEVTSVSAPVPAASSRTHLPPFQRIAPLEEVPQLISAATDDAPVSEDKASVAPAEVQPAAAMVIVARQTYEDKDEQESSDDADTDETVTDSDVEINAEVPAETVDQEVDLWGETITEDKQAEDAPTEEESDDDDQDEPSEKKSEPELTLELLTLRDKVQECLVYYFNKNEYAAGRSPWGIMHAAIAYGVDTQIVVDNRKVNALGWLCWNGSCRGQQLMYTLNGKLHVRQGAGVQGHAGQFLAILAQSRVKSDFGLKVSGYDFTVADLIEYEKQTCYAGTELTFKLIALSHYLPSDSTWKNEYDEEWSVSRLIKEELAQPVIGAACGGTHRMTGFSYAVRTRARRKEPMTGQWLRAKKFVDAYHDYTFKLQNDDGSFSTNYFNGRGDWGGPDRRLETTGHIVEWLAYSLPKNELRDPRMVKAIDYLASLMLEHKNSTWEIGPLGHALHALSIYDQRVFGAKVGQGGPQLVRASAEPATQD